MKADPVGVLTGEHYLDGDKACAEGGLAAGCRFLAGYPITPSTEVAERVSERFPMIGGIFIQMEDELAAMCAILGASWAGVKSMTVTSGPGFSLMMENIGLGVMMETPCVVVNVQRGGPSTGLPTLPGQADMMQARWGSHGDYEIIALSPNSPQECFDLTITAFNFSEKYRVPVMFMMDECVGHMTEKVVIPEAGHIDLVGRKYTRKKPEEYLPYEYGKDLVPEMVKAGDGYFFHVTGLTHDERGYPDMTWETQEKCVHRLIDKINKNADDIYLYEKDDLENADIVVLSYGITSRVALRGIQLAQEEGIKNIGRLRLITVWPFPEKLISDLASKIKE
jgi:2-oxoglutarate ferredoxin oxidoreductase subunit alpha